MATTYKRLLYNASLYAWWTVFPNAVLSHWFYARIDHFLNPARVVYIPPIQVVPFDILWWVSIYALHLAIGRRIKVSAQSTYPITKKRAFLIFCGAFIVAFFIWNTIQAFYETFYSRWLRLQF